MNTYKAKAHRWPLALAENCLTLGCLYEEKLWLEVCGDSCQMSRMEGAFLSGMAMAERVLGLTQSRRGPKI